MGAREGEQRLALAADRLQGQGSGRRAMDAGLCYAGRRLVSPTVQHLGEAELYAGVSHRPLDGLARVRVPLLEAERLLVRRGRRQDATSASHGDEPSP